MSNTPEQPEDEEEICNIVGGDCENPAEGKDCGDYGNNGCKDCYTSYINGEFEPDFNHPNQGRGA